MEVDIVFGVSLMLLVLAETYLAGRWYPFFYRSGIPIYNRTYHFPNVTAGKIDVAKLLTEFDNAWAPSLIFHEIGTDEYAFREALFQFRIFSYSPVMHGHIQILPHKAMVTVTGRLYWMILLVAAYLIFVVPMEWLPQSLLALGAVFAFLYFIQVRRFNRVAAFIRGQLGSSD